MTLLTYKRWLYLQEGDIIILRDGKRMIYRDYDHEKDGMLSLKLEGSDGTEYIARVHKESLFPVESALNKVEPFVEEPEPVIQRKMGKKKYFNNDVC